MQWKLSEFVYDFKFIWVRYTLLIANVVYQLWILTLYSIIDICLLLWEIESICYKCTKDNNTIDNYWKYCPLIISTILSARLYESKLIQFVNYIHPYIKFISYYTKPWAHAPVYLIGLLVGITYTEYTANGNKNNYLGIAQRYYEKKKKLCSYICYLTGLSILLTIGFGYRTC